ncbi:MAG: hypothetical protein VXW87_00110 [Pseudomonadota bacterium]|nr:hypothetical protein [Pseudomonadota bacterium]
MLVTIFDMSSGIAAPLDLVPILPAFLWGGWAVWLLIVFRGLLAFLLLI